ncbi:lactonase family protein [Burkholderia sp. R-69927]|uniref:lactonase family protein n=1 Tax=Paraburkholderia domus TaxID=2793075 RepID=UPI0019129AAE|nr:lactonase family protein [Paraburkholderia domus]MBK5091353.1 lactonase family protein [Burkholderia sp. R-69927]
MNTRTLVFAGCLNRAVPHFAAANGRGIVTYNFDEVTGRLEFLAETADIANPTFLAVVEHRGLLYATSEIFGEPEGTVSAYRVDPMSGALALINRQPTRGSLTAYCNVDRQAGTVFVANYGHETVAETPRQQIASFSVLDNGGLSPTSSEFGHTGSGPNVDRQSVPHAHCVVPSPDNRFAVATDLGTDELVTYRINVDSRRLESSGVPAMRMKVGAGPRHFVFHPNGVTAYVVNELDSTLCRLAYAPGNGTLRLLETVNALPENLGAGQPADLQIAADGRFLYASIRGADVLGIYRLEEGTGKIVSASVRGVGGKTPRSFALSPVGRFLLVALQDSDRLAVYRIDPTTGEPAEQVDLVAVGTPMCVKAARFDIA